MTTSDPDGTTFLATLDSLVTGLEKMLDELSRLIYTMAKHGQHTENPLALYRDLLETANHAKTLHAQEIEAMHIGAKKL